MKKIYEKKEKNLSKINCEKKKNFKKIKSKKSVGNYFFVYFVCNFFSNTFYSENNSYLVRSK